MTIIFSVPWLIWRVGRTDYYAPLVVVQILAGIVLGPGVLGAAYPDYYAFVFNPAVVQTLNGATVQASISRTLLTLSTAQFLLQPDDPLAKPPSRDSGYFAGDRPTVYSAPESKQRLALSRGARGTILLPSAQEPRWKDWEYWVRQYFEETVGLAYSVPRHLAVRLHPRLADHRRNPVKRLSAFGLPLIRRIVQTADCLAAAMEARCYTEVRTEPDLNARGPDWLAFGVALAALAAALAAESVRIDIPHCFY